MIIDYEQLNSKDDIESRAFIGGGGIGGLIYALLKVIFPGSRGKVEKLFISRGGCSGNKTQDILQLVDCAKCVGVRKIEIWFNIDLDVAKSLVIELDKTNYKSEVTYHSDIKLLLKVTFTY